MAGDHGPRHRLGRHRRQSRLRGRGNIPRDLHLATIGRNCAATSLPVTADLERGYDDVAATVRAGLDCGVVGANLEDDLCPVDLMTERVRVAVATGAAAGVPLVVNARTDVYLHGTALDAGERLREAQARGLAFLEAEADCVFVPGRAVADDIAVLVETFGPGRLGLLAVPGVPGAAELERLGVARLSHGPFPYRRALGALQAYRHGSPPASRSSNRTNAPNRLRCTPCTGCM